MNFDQIKNKQLVANKAFIGGRWIDANDKATFTVNNPADDSILGELPDLGKDEINQAINAANDAFKSWKNVSASERSALLHKWYQLVLDNADDLAAIMVLEQGKPLAEAKAEVLYAAKFIQWFSEQAKRIYGVVMSNYLPTSKLEYTKEPVGVVGIITPWNFPLAMITRKVAPALAAGCTCVIKPSDLTPYSALALMKLYEQAGLPPSACNLVTVKNPKDFGDLICESSVIRKISFTGSTPVGKKLLAQSASTVKKVSLELGGNAPFIVFDDADLEMSVNALLATKFRNTGQTCVCANRIFIQQNIHDEFVDKLISKLKTYKVADGFSSDVKQGPLITQPAFEKVKNHIKSAVSQGAEVVYGGEQHQKGLTFFEPTIIQGVDNESIFKYEETFGPVAPIVSFNEVEEAITYANDTKFGLSAYFCTQDFRKMHKVRAELETGMVGINEGILSNEFGPFGGIKESGIGREGSVLGIDEYLVYKYSVLNWS